MVKRRVEGINYDHADSWGQTFYVLPWCNLCTKGDFYDKPHKIRGLNDFSNNHYPKPGTYALEGCDCYWHESWLEPQNNKLLEDLINVQPMIGDTVSVNFYSPSNMDISIEELEKKGIKILEIKNLNTNEVAYSAPRAPTTTLEEDYKALGLLKDAPENIKVPAASVAFERAPDKVNVSTDAVAPMAPVKSEYQIGWWRTPSHVRKIQEYSKAKIEAKNKRIRRVKVSAIICIVSAVMALSAAASYLLAYNL